MNMEYVTVEKKTLQNFVLDLENLIADFEKMLDTSLEMESGNRLGEMKNKKIKALSEDDYKKFGSVEMLNC